MRRERRELSNWGHYPTIKAEIGYPRSVKEVRSEVLRHDRLIARGNGRCYGDAALAPQVLSTLCLNQIRSFDARQGIVEAEAGVLLADLLDVIVPAGWFFHVTPGTRFITIGGAIACDVHGKNHPHKGCFSNWLLDFELMRADGSILRCSRQENSDLFWQTCGGMGWTGIILSARFQLMRISSVFLRQRTLKVSSVEALIEAFENHRSWPYAVAWVDGLARGKQLGRSVLLLAEHIEEEQPSALAFPKRYALNMPFYAPHFLLNPAIIWAYNQLYFARARNGEHRIDLEQCFYPLDRIRNWNRLYGRRGLVQYQFGLPEASCVAGFRRALELLHRSGEAPFLCVVKRHGDRPPEAIHSFPERGYSLALDFPRTRTLPALVRQLDDLVWQLGGKVYLAKDACSAPRMGRLQPQAFAADKFWSLLRERVQQ
ncbi:MAG: FAD-binding oxidoreductase [Saprospiraceae bacterium]|nr:FAD-binding oxidoreductase [Saprospiraceae bacterium]MDW8229262.1 FAD-binding oxidoreductase [Saprospiraceae bacterium]